MGFARFGKFATMAFHTVLLAVVLGAPRNARAIAPIGGGVFHLYTDQTRGTPGLVGSYVDSNLRGVTSHADWRTTQVIAGTRIDAALDFQTDSWGSRAAVGLTHGTDADWDLFSVQWDGFVEIVTEGTRLLTESDDSSRMWIDVDHDGVFDPGGVEFVNNHWGNPQAPTRGDASVELAPGVYGIRIQYEEEYFGNRMRLLSAPIATVRFAYLIPSNRSPQPNGVTSYQEVVGLMRDWFCEQMDRLGFGPRSFRFETQEDGVTPKIHVVNLAEDDVYFHSDTWGRVQQSAAAAGVPLWTDGEVWLLVTETHVQQPDGSIMGEVALGAGFGSGTNPGVAMFGAATLSFRASGLTDDRPYAGLVIPTIGPLPLVQDVSFPWFEGTTVSSICSSHVGAMAHEMIHGFGLPHDFRNDDSFHGNVMANGLRGFRGAILPARYFQDDCRLEYTSALILSTSKYFQGCTLPPPPAFLGLEAAIGSGAKESGSTVSVKEVGWGWNLPDRPAGGTQAAFALVLGCDTDEQVVVSAVPRTPSLLEDDPPVLSVLTSGSVPLDNGLLPITFEATDATGLASAHLRLDGNAVDEMALAGTSSISTFRTMFHVPGTSNDYSITAYDVGGNASTVSFSLTPVGVNRAPQPFVKLKKSRSTIFAQIVLDAGRTTDPDDVPESVLYEWDLDDDGGFDTSPQASAVHRLALSTPQTKRVRVRVTDPHGAQAISTAIALRTDPADVSGTDPADAWRDGITISTTTNPFSTSSEVRFALAVPGTGSLQVFDVRGRLVKTLVSPTRLAAGHYSIRWRGETDSRDRVASGTYVCVLRFGSEVRCNKLTVLR